LKQPLSKLHVGLDCCLSIELLTTHPLWLGGKEEIRVGGSHTEGELLLQLVVEIDSGQLRLVLQILIAAVIWEMSSEYALEVRGVEELAALPALTPIDDRAGPKHGVPERLLCEILTSGEPVVLGRIGEQRCAFLWPEPVVGGPTLLLAAGVDRPPTAESQ